MKETGIFQSVLNDLPAYAATLASSDTKIIGYLCSYVPEEIILAAGCHPMRLFSSTTDTQLSDTHLQSYCCAPVKAVLQDSLAGRLDFLNGTVFPHACDTIARLSDIWRLNSNYGFFADLAWPTKLNTDSARHYVVDMLTAFSSQLEQYMKRPLTPEDLNDAIQVCNTVRSHIRTLYQLKSDAPDLISARDLYGMIKAAMVMDRNEVSALLSDVVKQLQEKALNTPSSDRKRIVVSGTVCDIPGLITPLEDTGAAIVGDDFCTGMRWVGTQIPQGQNPVEAIANAYIENITCPAKHHSLTRRIDQLSEQVVEAKADGVVFIQTKFCDPHAFDYPFLRDGLEKKGIKSLMIETDGVNSSAGQVQTRIETFLEIL